MSKNKSKRKNDKNENMYTWKRHITIGVEKSIVQLAKTNRNRTAGTVQKLIFRYDP